MDESRCRLKSDDSSIDPSTGTKHRESDYSLLRKLPYWNIGHNLYKRLHTPGETTSDSGRIDSGSGRNDSGRTGHIGRNDRKLLLCIVSISFLARKGRVCRWTSGLPWPSKTSQQTLHLSARENYGKRGEKRGVQWDFSHAGKLLVNVKFS